MRTIATSHYLQHIKRISILLLSCNFFCKHVQADIFVTTIQENYPSRAAAFGPIINSEGISGHLVPVESLAPYSQDGCKELEGKPMIQLRNENEKPRWFALVERGGCSFAEKVRAMQSSGAAGVVVGDNQKRDGLLVMYASGDTSDVLISSIFIAQWEYRELKFLISQKLELSKRNNSKNPNQTAPVYVPSLEVIITPDESTDWSTLDLVFITILIPGICLLLMYIVYRWKYRHDFMALEDARNRQLEQVIPTSQLPATLEEVNNLPLKTFLRSDKSENDAEICAICIEDFKDGDILRVLLCKHEFHKECIDPWLLTRKRTCPVCKTETCHATNTATHTPSSESLDLPNVGENVSSSMNVLIGSTAADNENYGEEEEEETLPLLSSSEQKHFGEDMEEAHSSRSCSFYSLNTTLENNDNDNEDTIEEARNSFCSQQDKIV